MNHNHHLSLGQANPRLRTISSLQRPTTAMKARSLEVLFKARQELEKQLDQLAIRRSKLRTQAERLKLIPEAGRITGGIQKVEREIEKDRIQRFEAVLAASSPRTALNMLAHQLEKEGMPKTAIHDFFREFYLRHKSLSDAIASVMEGL